MKPLIQHVDHASTFNLKDLVAYESGQVASLTLAQKKGVGLTVFAIDEGEGMSTHAAPGDAMALVLEGELKITIDGKDFQVNTGESIVMPANVPHAVYAVSKTKMFLTVVNQD